MPDKQCYLTVIVLESISIVGKYGIDNVIIGEGFMTKIGTPEYRVAQVAATLAIENMYIDEKFKEELLMVARKQKSSEELIDELNKRYKK